MARAQRPSGKGVVGIDRYRMDPSWKPTAVLPYLVLWAEVCGRYVFGSEEENSNTSRTAVVPAIRPKPFKTVFKVINTSRFLEKCCFREAVELQAFRGILWLGVQLVDLQKKRGGRFLNVFIAFRERERERERETSM